MGSSLDSTAVSANAIAPAWDIEHDDILVGFIHFIFISAAHISQT